MRTTMVNKVYTVIVDTGLQVEFDEAWKTALSNHFYPPVVNFLNAFFVYYWETPIQFEIQTHKEQGRQDNYGSEGFHDPFQLCRLLGFMRLFLNKHSPALWTQFSKYTSADLYDLTYGSSYNDLVSSRTRHHPEDF